MASAAGLSGIPLRDFSGGHNLRDAASELADNECVDAWNVTFDERGGAQSGDEQVHGTAKVQNMFDWKAGDADRAGGREAVQGHVDDGEQDVHDRRPCRVRGVRRKRRLPSGRRAVHVHGR